MLPKEPARRPQLGFLYVPPFRIQGLSIAGEETVVHVPELDVAFDIGLCPKAVLPAPYVALTHGHMDHIAGLGYYFSQRPFQGMTPGTVVCHPLLRAPIVGLMEAWAQIERQRVPHEIVTLEPGESLEVKNNHFLEAWKTDHTEPSLGYTVIEKRTRLKESYQGLEQDELVKLKKAGTDIVDTFRIPLVAYTGDTAFGDHLLTDVVLKAKVLIAECTFIEPGHRKRAGIGRHLHLEHIIELLEQGENEAIVLTHLSRRSHMGQVRRAIERAVPERHRHRLFVLMDNRANRERYDAQLAAAERDAAPAPDAG